MCLTPTTASIQSSAREYRPLTVAEVLNSAITLRHTAGDQRGEAAAAPCGQLMHSRLLNRSCPLERGH